MKYTILHIKIQDGENEYLIPALVRYEKEQDIFDYLKSFYHGGEVEDEDGLYSTFSQDGDRLWKLHSMNETTEEEFKSLTKYI